MASIKKRISKTGVVSYQAQIVIKKHGAVIHRESKTFDKKKLADDWGKRREIELQESEVYRRLDYLPISSLIEQYIERFKPDGRSKLFDLNRLARSDFAKTNIHTLTAKDLINHISQRNNECAPQTAKNDLIWLSTVTKTMRGVIDLGVDMSIFASAREVLRKEGLIAPPGERERRPTKAELWALSRHFRGKPMLHLMWFAIYSTRRVSEICRMEWDDVNHDNKTILIRDLKDPRKKGAFARAKLPRSAYKILCRQPRTGQRVFDYSPKTVTTYFGNACKLLGIKDLHFHDLRHEATSRLFERGLSIQQVCQVTLHKQWSTLKRYTNLDPGDLDI
jgi:integrase